MAKYRTNPKVRSTSRRRGIRGAALVEAAVVLPCMLVFLGLIMFTYRSYGMKLDQQTKLRAEVLTYASHNCQGDPQAVNFDIGDPTVGSAGTDRVADSLKMEQAGVGSFSPTVNKARGSRSAMVRGSAANDRKLVTFSRPVSSTSIVACNQKAYRSGFWGLLTIAGDLAASGGRGMF